MKQGRNAPLFFYVLHRLPPFQRVSNNTITLPKEEKMDCKILSEEKAFAFVRKHAPENLKLYKKLNAKPVFCSGLFSSKRLIGVKIYFELTKIHAKTSLRDFSARKENFCETDSVYDFKRIEESKFIDLKLVLDKFCFKVCKKKLPRTCYTRFLVPQKIPKSLQRSLKKKKFVRKKRKKARSP